MPVDLMVTNSKTVPGALVRCVLLLRSTFVKYWEWKQEIKLLTFTGLKKKKETLTKNTHNQPTISANRICTCWVDLTQKKQHWKDQRQEYWIIKAEKLYKRSERKTFDQLKANSRLTHPVLFSISNMKQFKGHQRKSYW